VCQDKIGRLGGVAGSVVLYVNYSIIIIYLYLDFVCYIETTRYTTKVEIRCTRSAKVSRTS
jgi:hypothetical protein